MAKHEKLDMTVLRCAWMAVYGVYRGILDSLVKPEPIEVLMVSILVTGKARLKQLRRSG